MSDIYRSGQYLESNPDWHTGDSAWKASKIARMLNRHAIAPTTLYEVGCGAGEILVQLQGRFPDCAMTGYDISDQALALCASRANAKLQFKNRITNPITEKASVAIAIDVFEHVPDYLGFLREFQQTADYKMFHIPLELTAENAMRSKILEGARASMGHIHYFNKATALAALKACGYRIIDSEYTAWQFELYGARRPLMRTILLKALSLVDRDLAVNFMGGHSLLVLAT